MSHAHRHEFFEDPNSDARIEVERDARALEGKFRGILDSMPDAVVIVNTTGRIVLANALTTSLYCSDISRVNSLDSRSSD